MFLRRARRRPLPSLSDLPRADLSPLLVASHAVNSVLGVQEALQVVLGSAKELLGAHEGSVMLLGSDGYLRVLASEGIPFQIASSVKVAQGEGIAGKVAQSGVPLLIGGHPDETQFRSFIEKDRPLRSALSVPLKAAGRTVGVLNLNITGGERHFDDQDLRVAQVFGDQAAMAIHKAQLLEESQRRGSELSLLFGASRDLIGVLELEPLLTKVLDGATKIVPSRAGFVSLLNEEEARLSLGLYRGIARHEIRMVLGSPAFPPLFHGEGVSVVEAEQHPAFKEISTPGERATIVPMRAEGKVRALLVLVGDSTHQPQVGMLETFAGQAGLAIRNAQLYRQVDDKETELASIMFSMPNPVVVVDPSGRIVVANPAAEELFGFSSAYIKGQNIRGILGESELEGLLTGNSTGVVEVSLGHPVPRIWKARSAIISIPENPNRGRVLILDDVTAEREIESLKSDFVAMIGHELRTPLTSIKGFLKTLLSRGHLMNEEGRQEALQTAEAQTRKLERLIEDLLYISRVEQTRESLFLETIDLVGLTEALLQEFRSRELQRSLSLEGPDALKTVLDRTKIEQVIYHLLDNACKYSDADAPVSVEIRDLNDQVEVRVVDKGIGMLSTDVAHIFDRFHQVDLSSTRRHGGTGVGLYICRRFVQEHGGRIDVQTAWGKGSTFSFTIPKGLAPKA
jgi:signal transduction histidine kinase